MRTDLFDYPLPPERIAQHPLPDRALLAPRMAQWLICCA